MYKKALQVSVAKRPYRNGGMLLQSNYSILGIWDSVPNSALAPHLSPNPMNNIWNP